MTGKLPQLWPPQRKNGEKGRMFTNCGEETTISYARAIWKNSADR